MNVVYVCEHGMFCFVFFFAHLCVFFVFAIVDNKVYIYKKKSRKKGYHLFAVCRFPVKTDHTQVFQPHFKISFGDWQFILNTLHHYSTCSICTTLPGVQHYLITKPNDPLISYIMGFWLT